MKILFLQDFSMGRKGGGVTILKRLMEYAPSGVTITVAYDRAADPGIKPLDGERTFFSLPRNVRFGIGRLMGWCTICGLDFWAVLSTKRLIKKENPDVVHLVAHGVCFPVTAHAAFKSGKQVVVSVHDIWQWTVGPYISERLAAGIFKSIIQRADKVFVISREMGEYLAGMCGEREYLVVHDGTDRQLPDVQKMKGRDRISFLYVGLLHQMQVKQFDLLLEAMGDIPDMLFTVGVCSNTNYEPSTVPANVSIVNYGWRKEEEVQSISLDYQFGLLPLSFNQADELFYRTSLMTKIPFYTGILLPIICVGPATASAVKLIKREQIGIVCTRDDRSDLTLLIRRIVDELPDQYDYYVVNMRRTAATVFNMQLIAKRFYDNLENNQLEH